MIIAQLSDIHADGSSNRLDRLDRVLSWLRPLRPDALVVSGDLAEAQFEKSYAAVRQRLDSVGCPFFVVPGNVDDHRHMRAGFGELYGWTTDRPLSVVGRFDGFRVIGLDVTVEDAHHGDAAPRLDWLAAELAADQTPTLIFQHQHPFLTGIDNKDRNICFGGVELAAVIEAAGDVVLGLTCGHVHRPLFTQFARRQATMGSSVTRANKLRLDGKESDITDPPGLMLHHVADGRLVSHVVMVS
ncbi:metallophosphoesterase [Devosia rhizoryzae]|uniref:Metallophosphoesterase n=1 Tax=Devosia rhizoryzae TaxID=2774137 RepID=A0ABX7C8P7_9HYPH|nr:metallophosphoesterase [Devosia rhizoryzae]QQR40127.1 metallophosphoesterase [Devosia rhizoryzae]